MATKYFNKYDRERMMVLALLISRLPDIIDNFSKNLMDNKQRGRVKAAHKHLDTVFNEIVQSVDWQQCKQLHRGIMHHDIKVVETSSLTKKRGRREQRYFPRPHGGCSRRAMLSM